MFVRQTGPFEQVSREELDRALSPANQLQSAAYGLFAVGVPTAVAGLGLGIVALVLAGGGCITICYGGRSSGSPSYGHVGLLLGVGAVGLVVSAIAAWLDGEADRRADDIRRRTFGFDVEFASHGARVTLGGRF